jgi:hypothetical protein
VGTAVDAAGWPVLPDAKGLSDVGRALVQVSVECRKSVFVSAWLVEGGSALYRSCFV